MSLLRRYYSPGNSYFVTGVTYDRKPILVKNYDLFKQSIAITKEQLPFEMPAWVILPEHFHMLVEPGQSDLSEIIKRIKLSFAGKYRIRNRARGGRVWQLRFWDHIIRNESDMNRHIDYIHYNPVKHGLVRRPIDYEHSSFRRFIADGFYTSNWGEMEEVELSGEFGE